MQSRNERSESRKSVKGTYRNQTAGQNSFLSFRKNQNILAALSYF